MRNSLEKQQKPKRAPRRDSIPLTTVGNVRSEMGKVYRLARAGNMPINDMTKFVYALREIGRIIESSDLEARLNALEQAQENDNNGKFGR